MVGGSASCCRAAIQSRHGGMKEEGEASADGVARGEAAGLAVDVYRGWAGALSAVGGAARAGVVVLCVVDRVVHDGGGAVLAVAVLAVVAVAAAAAAAVVVVVAGPAPVAAALAPSAVSCLCRPKGSREGERRRS